jgi:predicted Zn-dependent peptidase
MSARRALSTAMGTLTRRRLFSLTAAAAAMAAFPTAQHSSAQTEPLVQQTLVNGLTVIIQERPSADTVALQHTALAGVRDDGDQPGITVLTSRMLLSGTPRRPSDIDMKRAATLVGGTISRGTTSEVSSIAAVMPAESAELAFDLISDALVNPSLTALAFLTQQQLAIQGLSQRRSDPSVLIDDLFQQSLFASQPLGFAPLGTEASIESATLDEIAATRQRLFGAANAVLTITGRIRTNDALGLAEQYFGPLFSGTANVRVPTDAVQPQSPETVTGTAGQQQSFRVGFVAPSLADTDRYAMDVLTGMMTGFSGRLVRELRTKRGISYTPSAAYIGYSDAGLWYATAVVDPDTLNEALDVTRSEIERIAAEQAGASEVADAADATAGQQVLATESNAEVAALLASQQILGDVSTEEYVRRIQAVTPADVQRVAGAYLDLDHSLTVLVGPPPAS